MPPRNASAVELAKCPTGIAGLDEITNGGIPRGRPTLICGGPGCGKTLFGIEFLVNGAMQGEPGVFVAFEERPEELAQNVTSLGFTLFASTPKMGQQVRPSDPQSRSFPIPLLPRSRSRAARQPSRRFYFSGAVALR